MWLSSVAKCYTFSRSLRLCKKKDFQFVYKTGRTFVDNAGIFYVFNNNNDVSSRIGVAAGKKLGNAVLRNRMKRCMREVYRHFQGNIAKGVDIIWIARRPLIKAEMKFFEKSFIKLAKRAGIFLKKED